LFCEAEEHPTLELVTETTDLNADPAKITLILEPTSEALLKRHHHPLRLADSYSKGKIIYKRGYLSKTYGIREIEGKTREHVLIAQRKNTE